MKKLSSAIVVLLFIQLAFAQQVIRIEETPRPMSKGTQPSFFVVIPQNTLDDVQKNWEKYITGKSKAKAVVADGETNIVGTSVSNISPNPLNIYSRLMETNEGVQLTVWVTENDSVFISNEMNTQQNLAINKFIRDFAVEQYKTAVKKELDAEKSKLAEMEKEMKNFIKAEDKSNKKIGDNQRSIQRAQDDIYRITAEIRQTEDKITEQDAMVRKTVSDPNANKGAKKTLKDLENQKKSQQKARDNSSKNIDKWNTEIRAEERNMAALKKQQETKVNEMEAQRQKVQQVQAKLDGIQ